MNSKTALIVLGSVAAVGVIIWQSGALQQTGTGTTQSTTNQVNDADKNIVSAPTKDNNNQSNEDDIAVKFKNIPVVMKKDVEEDIKALPSRMQSRMTITQARVFVTMIKAVRSVLAYEATKNGMDKDAKISEFINKRSRAEVIRLYMQKIEKDTENNESLVNAEYANYYNEKLKGTKSYKCKIIVSLDRAAVMQFVGLKTEKDVQAKAAAVKRVVVRDMDDVIESDMFPELREELKQCTANSTLGPVSVDMGNGQIMHCVVYVVDIKDLVQEKQCPARFKNIILGRIVSKRVNDVAKNHGVKYFEFSGKEIDIDNFNDAIKNLEKQDIKDEFVIAMIGKEKITVGRLLKYLEVTGGIDGPEFTQVAQEIGNGNSIVALYRLCRQYVENEVLYKVVETEKFDKTEKCQKVINEIRDAAYAQAHLSNMCSTVSETEVQNQMSTLVQEYNSDPKNKYTYSLKMIAFRNKEEAERKLQEILSGKVKFTDYYDEVTKKNPEGVEAHPLENVTRKSLGDEMFKLVSDTKPGTCAKSIANVVDGVHIIIYVANKGQVSAPNMKNPADREQAKQLARVAKATEYLVRTLSNEVIKLDGRDDVRGELERNRVVLTMIATQLMNMGDRTNRYGYSLI